MPYAVVVVSVLGALTPQLAGFATDEDFDGLAERLRFGLRQSLVIIIPCTFVLVVLAQPLVAILLNHVNATHTLAAGTVLAVLAAGLPGFTVFQLAVRGLQSMQRAREVFVLYFFENALTIVLCVALGRHSLAGLTASVSIGYSVTAIAALVVLARHRVNIISGVWSVHVRRSLAASVVATVAVAALYALPAWTHGVGLVVRFAAALLGGVLVYLVAVVALRRRLRRAHAKGARLGGF
jgi:peptidoglycan biosynthesis protein MviN/MurJ (putative lipid II flippase)